MRRNRGGVRAASRRHGQALLHEWAVWQTGSIRCVGFFHVLTDLSGMIGLVLLGLR
jgi:hypothetical protein